MPLSTWASGTVGVIFGTSLATATNFITLPSLAVAPVGTIFSIEIDPDLHPASTLSCAWCSNNTTPPPGASTLADPIGKGSFSFSVRPIGVTHVAFWQAGSNFGSGILGLYGYTTPRRMIFINT